MCEGGKCEHGGQPVSQARADDPTVLPGLRGGSGKEMREMSSWIWRTQGREKTNAGTWTLKAATGVRCLDRADDHVAHCRSALV